MLAAFTRGERMWVGLMFNRVRAEWVGGGSFSHPALPGWFLEALVRVLAALACSLQREVAEKFRSARGWRAADRVRGQRFSCPWGLRIDRAAAESFGWGERSRARSAGASAARYHRLSHGFAQQ